MLLLLLLLLLLLGCQVVPTDTPLLLPGCTYTVLPLLLLPWMPEGIIVTPNTVFPSLLLPLLGWYVAGPAGYHPAELVTLPAGWLPAMVISPLSSPIVYVVVVALPPYPAVVVTSPPGLLVTTAASSSSAVMS
jgi:hypothetical protein